MTRQDDQSDPSNPAPPSDRAKDEAAPRAPFQPPVSNPSVLAILKGLNPSVTPVPMEVSSTDGELSASFTSSLREAPHREPTPVPEASVVVRKSVLPDAQPKRSSKNAAGSKESKEALTTTFRIRPTDRSSAVVVIVAVLVVGVGIAAWLGRSAALDGIKTPPAQASAPPSANAAPRAPAPPIAPSPIPPPPQAPEAIPPANATDPAVTAPAPPSPKAAPSSTPAVKPTKDSPSRRKEDEPERVL
jgi:hypothetical protein